MSFNYPSKKKLREKNEVGIDYSDEINSNFIALKGEDN